MKKLILAVALVVAFAAPSSPTPSPTATCPAKRGPHSLRTSPRATARPANQLEKRRTPMKSIIIAVALIVASAAPVLAQDFPQSYSQNR